MVLQCKNDFSLKIEAKFWEAFNFDKNNMFMANIIGLLKKSYQKVTGI